MFAYRIRIVKATDGRWFVAEYKRGANSTWREYSGVVSRSWDVCYTYLETRSNHETLAIKFVGTFK